MSLETIGITTLLLPISSSLGNFKYLAWLSLGKIPNAGDTHWPIGPLLGISKCWMSLMAAPLDEGEFPKEWEPC